MLKTIAAFFAGTFLGIPILTLAWNYFQAHSATLLSQTNNTAIISHVVTLAGQALK